MTWLTDNTLPALYHAQIGTELGEHKELVKNPLLMGLWSLTQTQSKGIIARQITKRF